MWWHGQHRSTTLAAALFKAMVALATFASLGQVDQCSGSQESTADLKHRSAHHPQRLGMEICGGCYCTSKPAELVTDVIDAVTHHYVQWSSVIHFVTLRYALICTRSTLSTLAPLGLPSQRCPTARLKAWASGATTVFSKPRIAIAKWNKWNKWNPTWNPKRREATHIHPPGGKYGPLRESSRPSGTSASVKKLATHGDAQWRHHETSLIEFDRSQTFRSKSIYKIEKPYMKQW